MELKLLVDNRSSKVLFVEADKASVDFLFSILALPLGTVTRLLKQKDGMVGSLGVLYNSIISLSDSYIQPDITKEAVLRPKVSLPFADDNVPLLKYVGVVYADKKLYRCSFCKSSILSVNPQSSCPSCSEDMNVELTFLNSLATVDYADTKLYLCPNICKYITDDPETTCRSCNDKMDTEVCCIFTSSAATEKGEGYVKGVVAYMVMDDLAVKPMSTISSMSLLNTFDIKDVGVLEEKTVALGMAECLKLLRASLHSKTVLTDVFLRTTEA